MYDTRISVVQDENAVLGAKMHIHKGSNAVGNVNQNQNCHPLQVSNRRALGEIGNLVGALSKRCTVSKDQLENAALVEQIAKIDRPITRKFGTDLANKVQNLVQNVLPSVAEKESSDLAWRSKQRRTMVKQAAVNTKDFKAVHDDRLLPHMTAQLQRPSRIPGFDMKKNSSLTSTLTSRSEATCLEVEMEEAEEPLPNIDESDIGNQLAVVDYVEDIYGFYRSTEAQSCVPPDYMSRQSDINERMRAILIDWLIEVHLKFKLMPESLYLTINLIDRYLACQPVMRKNLQLVGVTAMLLASKYEEIWAPEVNDFVIISDNAYSRQQILDMEKDMLNKLKFNLTVPTPYVFLVRFLKAAGSDTQLEMLSFFLVDLCLTEYSMLQYCPSILAAAAVYTAQQTLKRLPSWSTTLQRHTGYTEMHLRDCAVRMVGFHRSAREGNLTVVHRKYSNPKFNSVALLEPTCLPM